MAGYPEEAQSEMFKNMKKKAILAKKKIKAKELAAKKAANAKKAALGPGGKIVGFSPLLGDGFTKGGDIGRGGRNSPGLLGPLGKKGKGKHAMVMTTAANEQRMQEGRARREARREHAEKMQAEGKVTIAFGQRIVEKPKRKKGDGTPPLEEVAGVPVRLRAVSSMASLESGSSGCRLMGEGGTRRSGTPGEYGREGSGSGGSDGEMLCISSDGGAGSGGKGLSKQTARLRHGGGPIPLGSSHGERGAGGLDWRQLPERQSHWGQGGSHGWGGVSRSPRLDLERGGGVDPLRRAADHVRSHSSIDNFESHFGSPPPAPGLRVGPGGSGPPSREASVDPVLEVQQGERRGSDLITERRDSRNRRSVGEQPADPSALGRYV